MRPSGISTSSMCTEQFPEYFDGHKSHMELNNRDSKAIGLQPTMYIRLAASRPGVGKFANVYSSIQRPRCVEEMLYKADIEAASLY